MNYGTNFFVACGFAIGGPKLFILKTNASLENILFIITNTVQIYYSFSNLYNIKKPFSKDNFETELCSILLRFADL